MKEFGIDISAHKRNFDFGMAVSEGVKFILPRGAYSAPAVVSGGGRDTAFVDYYEKSVAIGLPGITCFDNIFCSASETIRTPL